tara:strand:- start:496 stop:816 length:321 start_codon:yes stop_codon:yes gene_type:complete
MNNITKNTYRTLTYSIYILYILVFLGLWGGAPQYLNDLNYYLKIFVGTILTYTFNPFYEIKFDNIHKDIAFTAGIILLTSTSLSSFKERIDNTINRFIKIDSKLLQ